MTKRYNQLYLTSCTILFLDILSHQTVHKCSLNTDWTVLVIKTLVYTEREQTDRQTHKQTEK